VDIRFGHALEQVDFDQQLLHFTGAGGVRSFQVLVGADGGGSAVRQAMARVTELGLSEELLDHGYRELTLPAGRDGEFQLDPHALHIWPRGGYMLIALPNADHSFTMTLFLANEGTSPSFESLAEWQDWDHFCRSQFADVYPQLTQLREDFANPVGLLGTIRCQRWHLDGRAVLLGDAAHAVVPFHGQGMNAAFEDCVLLAELAADGEADWDEVFETFENRRRSNANAIADMALENYAIMRESVRDPRFLLRKALEHELERRHPQQFVARYSLVMFQRIAYVEAQQRGRIQAHILDRLLEDVDTLDAIDWQAAHDLIIAQLEPIDDKPGGP
jgi:kynurenine 3-monooxygenase